MTSRDWAIELGGLDPSLWPTFLTENSGLPGPRANLSLASAVGDLGDRALADRLTTDDDEYLAMCGAIIRARHAADADADADAEAKAEADAHPDADVDLALDADADTGAGPETDADADAHAHAQTKTHADAGAHTRPHAAPSLRALAADARWRVREGVALGLQRLGDDDPDTLLAIVAAWARDPHPLVQRAAVAAVCEPRLLRSPAAAAAALDACRTTTANLVATAVETRRDSEWRTLRQALGYCWSVAVAGDPSTGLPLFRALDDSDADVAWIVRENTAKKRLARLL
ncbi:MAG: HEAT repeat domain-containing protein [Microbacterium enclense]